jgi:hypothetical protein
VARSAGLECNASRTAVHLAARFLAGSVEGRVELKTCIYGSREESMHRIIYGGWLLFTQYGVHNKGINCPL